MYGRRRVTLPLNAALSSGLRMSQRASRSSRAFLEYKNIIRYEKDDSHGSSPSMPETPDEWRGRVSPVNVFPRVRFSNGTTRQNFAGFLKMTQLFWRQSAF